MKNLHLTELPDDVYDAIERRARAAGRTPEKEAAEILARNVANEQNEATLLEEIRKDREEMAKEGVYLTDEDIQSAIDWGRE
jgi:plasmid stability protein